MKWTIEIFFMLVLTTVSGSVCTILWFVLKQILYRYGSAKSIYLVLRFVMLSYVLPVFFVTRLIFYNLSGGVNGNIFSVTPLLRHIIYVVLVIWLLGLFVTALVHMGDLFKCFSLSQKQCKGTLHQRQVFDVVHKECRLKRKIQIRQSYAITSPLITGFFHPKIYLPMQEFSEEQYKTIFYHEIAHYLQGDYIWKPVFALICIIFWFNPLAWYTEKQMVLWAEAGCDALCCERLESSKQYFMYIIDMLEQQNKDKKSFFMPMWFENKKELEWRIKYMSYSKKYKKISKGFLSFIVILSMILGVSASYVTSSKAMKIYNGLYEVTEVSKKEVNSVTAIVDEDVELIEMEELDSIYDGTDVYEQRKSAVSTFSDIRAIDWNVKADSSYQSIDFKVTKGGKITVLVSVEPSNKTIKIGIKQPNGVNRYVKGSGSFTYTFSVTQTGYHKVYVVNNNSVKVNVKGSYYWE